MTTELRLDWYEATLECDVLTVLAIATLATGGGPEGSESTTKVGRGTNGYKRKTVIEGNGLTITVMDLGTDGWPHIIGSGQNAEYAQLIARAATPVGRVSRVDIASDAIEPWYKAVLRANEWADTHPNATILDVGDFYRGIKGRTIYIGAPTSERRVRLYEKGIQLGKDPNWIRVELQLRPNGRPAKEWAYNSSVDELANSSRAFVALRAAEGLYTPPAYRPSERQPLFALAHQYGNVLREQIPEAWRIIVDHLKLDWSPN